MLPSTFIYKHAYKAMEILFINYCIYEYLKETYQFEDEMLILEEEVQRQGEQILDIAKKHDCNFKLSNIVGESYVYFNYEILNNKDKFVTIIENELIKINKDIFIDKNLIKKIGEDYKSYIDFFKK